MSAAHGHVGKRWDWGGPLRLAIGLLSAFLLISMGGAQAMAAPATMPAMWWATRTAHSTIARYLLTLVASLTMLIVGWMIPYNIVGENAVAMVIGMVAGVAGTIVVFMRTAWPKAPAGPSRA